MANSKIKPEAKPRRETCDFCYRKRERRFMDMANIKDRTFVFCDKFTAHHTQYIKSIGGVQTDCRKEFEKLKALINAIPKKDFEEIKFYFRIE